MTEALFVLPGIDATDKVPDHYSQNLFGQGKSSGARPWYVVCTGNKTSDGTMTADADVEQVFSADEVATKVGIRSECAHQAREALESGAAVFLAPVAEAAGAVAATLVLNCEELGTGTGQVTLHLGDETVSWVVDVASKLNTMTAATAAVNAVNTLFCVATIGGATDYDVTLTVSSAGIRGNDWLAKLDMSQAPSGCLFTIGRDTDIDSVKTSYATVAGAEEYTTTELTGATGDDPFTPPRRPMITLAVGVGAYVNGSTVTFTGTLGGVAQVEALTITGTGGGITVIGVEFFDHITKIDVEAQATTGGSIQYGLYSEAEPTSSGWVRFAGGTGTDVVTTVLGLLEASEYRRIAAAQNDATNAARFETHVDAESAPLVAHLEQVVFGMNGTSAAAISLAQTTLNAYLCQVAAQRNSRKHPCQIAAKVAAQRAVYEASIAWTRFDGKWNDPGAQLWTDVASHADDIWTHGELKALLNAGVTPINDFNGDTRIVRSICSHSLNGTNPDYRCLDTADVTVPQYVRDRVNALATEDAEQNEGVGPDLPDGLPQIEGISTPRIFNATITAELEAIQALGWIVDVATNPPITAYNSVSKRNETIVPVVVRSHQHQILSSIRQVAG